MISLKFLIPKCTRFLSLRRFSNNNSFFQLHNLNSAVSNAEKVVGYSTSFLNLRWLLNDELANIAVHCRKLIGIDHSLIKTARHLFFGHGAAPWGLIVLLISKACRPNCKFNHNEQDLTAGVLNSQRVVAEIAEMIRISHLIHSCVMNTEENSVFQDDFNTGNKMSILIGDYLLSKCFHELANLGNSYLNELIASSERDLATSVFFGDTDKKGVPFPCKPYLNQKNVEIVDCVDNEPYNVNEVLGYPRAEWTLRNILGGASHLGKSCAGALLLGDHPKEIQNLGYRCGKNIALAWQAKLEVEAFENANDINLVSAPVMLHLETDPSFYEKILVGKDDFNKIDFQVIKQTILKGGALEEAKQLQYKYSYLALEELKKLPLSDAQIALQNIVYQMQ